MQNIINNVAHGIFTANNISFSTVNDSSLTSDVSECKDPIAMIVDTTADKNNSYSIVFTDVNGNAAKTVSLLKGATSVIHFTTHGLISNGRIKFEIKGGTAPESAGIKIAMLKYSPVVNN